MGVSLREKQIFVWFLHRSDSYDHHQKECTTGLVRISLFVILASVVEAIFIMVVLLVKHQNSYLGAYVGIIPGKNNLIRLLKLDRVEFLSEVFFASLQSTRGISTIRFEGSI